MSEATEVMESAFLGGIPWRKMPRDTVPLEVKPPFFIGWFTSCTIILLGVYHHPKGTTIFKMVVDFQGY